MRLFKFFYFFVIFILIFKISVKLQGNKDNFYPVFLISKYRLKCEAKLIINAFRVIQQRQ